MPDIRTFTIEEANALLPEVIRLTETAAQRMAALRAATEETELDLSAQERAIADEWARTVAAMGILPKGVFVVDFVSRGDPSLLYCWAYGEPRVANQHGVSETFADRQPIPGWSLQETVQ